MKKIISLILLIGSISAFATFTPNDTICGKIEQYFDHTMLLTYSGEKELTTYDIIVQTQLDGLHTGTKTCVQGRVVGHDEILVTKVLPFFIP